MNAIVTLKQKVNKPRVCHEKQNAVMLTSMLGGRNTEGWMTFSQGALLLVYSDMELRSKNVDKDAVIKIL